MEVVATIRFTTPCLGNVRGAVNKMQRNRDGKVIFLQTWWRSGLGYAAQALNMASKEAIKIQSDPVVEGETVVHRRYYGPANYQEHEAFGVNSEIRVRFSLPRGMTPESFLALLDMAGRYVGISPYGYKDDYGRFEVVSVSSAVKGGQA